MKVEPLVVRPLSKDAFAPFGEVIETDGAEVRLINSGTTERFHALATATVGDGARAILSIFRGRPFAPPIDIVMLERHPLGSQAFVPLDRRPFVVVVAPDDGGVPGTPQAFLARANQGVNYARNVWHHPLIALGAVSDFLVVDRDGAGSNLEEHFFSDRLYRIAALPHASA